MDMRMHKYFYIPLLFNITKLGKFPNHTIHCPLIVTDTPRIKGIKR